MGLVERYRGDPAARGPDLLRQLGGTPFIPMEGEGHGGPFGGEGASDGTTDAPGSPRDDDRAVAKSCLHGGPPLVSRSSAACRRRPRERATREYIQGVASTSALSTADELAKLAELRNSGVITEEEFNAQKATLLAQT